jgi:hypothetical protein
MDQDSTSEARIRKVVMTIGQVPVFLEKGEALYAGKIPQKLFTMPSICQFPILEWTDK